MIGNRDRHLLSHSWIGTGTMPVAWGLDGKEWYRLSSDHNDQVNFAMADGSVQTINVNIDIWKFRYHAGMQERQPTEGL